jgi:DnaJ-class molecular chaperone
MRPNEAASKGNAQEPREDRECRSCYGAGVVVEDVELMTGEVVTEAMTCPICKGVGVVSVYLYPKPRRRSR